MDCLQVKYSQKGTTDVMKKPNVFKLFPDHAGKRKLNNKTIDQYRNFKFTVM